MTREELDKRRTEKQERAKTTVSREGKATSLGLPVKGGETTLRAADKRWGTTVAKVSRQADKRWGIVVHKAVSPVVVRPVEKTWKRFTEEAPEELDGVLQETVAMQDG